MPPPSPDLPLPLRCVPASAPPLEKDTFGSPSISELFSGLEEGDKTPPAEDEPEEAARHARYARTELGDTFPAPPALGESTLNAGREAHSGMLTCWMFGVFIFSKRKTTQRYAPNTKQANTR